MPTPPDAVDCNERERRADELEASGRLLDAARVLETVPRAERDPTIDARIVALRHRAFRSLPTVAPRHDAAVSADPWPGRMGAPELPWAEVDVEVLTAALHHHGCLLVRGLVPPEVVRRLEGDIDRAFEAFDASRSDPTPSPTERGPDATDPWRAPLAVADGYTPPDPVGTFFLREGGGVYAPDAPRAFVDYRLDLERAGLIDLVAAYLGAVPVASVNKTVLRRIHGGASPAWHQDGGYLGVRGRAINLWLALSPCGADTDRMGLDIMPSDRHELAEVGTHDAVDERAISQKVARDLVAASGRPVERPYFAPGDGILFDQFFVHRSDVRPLEADRYAIESWFFTADDYPDHLVPVVAG